MKTRFNEFDQVLS